MNVLFVFHLVELPACLYGYIRMGAQCICRYACFDMYVQYMYSTLHTGTIHVHVHVRYMYIHVGHPAPLLSLTCPSLHL